LTTLDAIFLGLLQGIAEFLPISSSGHLTLAQTIMALQEAPLTINLALHVATLLVVVIFFRAKIRKLLFPLDLNYLKAIIVCSIPTGIIGLGIKEMGAALFEQGHWSAVFLCCNGLFLIALHYKLKPSPHEQTDLPEAPTMRQAFLIGVVQGVAALPGISRSGSTIGCARALGLPAAVAAEFSLLASLPVIFGAALLESKDFVSFSHPGLMSLSFIIAMISGWVSVGLLLKIVSKDAWKWWGFYCLAAGALYLALYAR